LKQRWESVMAYLEENRQNIFYLIVFYVITLALFIERFMREYIIIYT
jgi:dual oxidase